MNKQSERSTSRTPHWLVQRAAQTFRHEGIPSFLRRTLAYLGYKSGIWYVGWYSRNLDSPIEPVTPLLDVRLAILTTDDAEEYLRFRSGITNEQYVERLRQGQVCFALRDRAGMLTSVNWMATDRIRVDFVDREVTLQKNEAYLHDSYTAPACRGKHLLPLLRSHILTHCKENGYRQVTVIIAPENRSSINSCTRSGFVRTGWLLRIRIGALRHEIFRGTR